MKKIMSFLMISFIIAINIHVHAVSDYDGEAWHQGLQAQAPIRGQWLLRKTIFLWKKIMRKICPPARPRTSV